MEGLVLVIVLLSFVVLGFVSYGIASFIGWVQNRKWDKWRAYCFENYPELKVLLSEYSRLREERCETVKDAVKLQKDIDEWTEKNKYLPRTHRVDGHIEKLKEYYQELLDIRTEQSELVDKAKYDLDKFWENNFPNIPEHKRIMWLD